MPRASLLVLVSALVTSCGPTDRDLAAIVSAKIAAHPDTRSADIRVTVNDGVARLSGLTSTRAEQEGAMEIASRTPGVEAVSSGLGIRDAVIAEAVRRAFAADERLSRIPIAIDVSDSVVSLRSSETDDVIRQRAVGLAYGVYGVTEVVDLMK
jgi:osmotically-inducible protein OsmY